MPIYGFQLLRFRPDVDMSSKQRDASASRSKPPAAAKSAPSTPGKSAPSTPGKMKPSKSDIAGLSANSTPKKHALVGRPANSPLGKAFLSRSHDNLASHPKSKLAALEKRPSSSLGLPEHKKKTASNKENVNTKDKDGFAKPKPVKPVQTSTPIRKASSSHHIDKVGSAHHSKTPTKSAASMKRAHSTQNVSKEKSVKNRKSATPDVMAYNAELLANFEKEKKCLEAKISEQIQIAESRKMDIEKHKYEIKQLKEQIPSHDLNEEVDILRAQNAMYKEQLVKLGIPVDSQITDSEKLSLMKANQREGETNLISSTSYDSLSTDGQPVSMVHGILGQGE